MGVFCQQFWNLLAAMAPWLLLGFAVAGILSVLIPASFVARHLGGQGFLPVLKATLIGIPLPLCSCSVIPVAVGLRQQGAGKGATTAFLISTPETGVDSILATWSLMGPVMALARPIAALATGLAGGLLVGRDTDPAPAATTTAGSCCHAVPQPSVRPEPTSAPSCCQAKVSSASPRKILAALRHAFLTLPKDTGPALALGLVATALVTVLVPPDALAGFLGHGFLGILVLMAAGVPIYVCASASVPLALGFLHLGASPGAALAFLISGPATNGATIAALWSLLGRRAALIYLGTIAGGALGFGLALDGLVSRWPSLLPQVMASTHDHGHSTTPWWNHAAGLVLIAILILAQVLARRKVRA